MLARSESEDTIPQSPARGGERRARGLLAATIHLERDPLVAVSLVADLDAAAIARVRQAALVMRAREQSPVVIAVRYVADADAAALIATLDALAVHQIRVAPTVLAPRPSASPAAPPTAAPSAAASAADDPFGLDPEFRARWIPPLRFFFERYWRVEVSGIEHVPSTGAALIAANHSGAVPADAVMLCIALELRHPARRCLRVLYDKFVDALPFLGPLYNRLGGISASSANAEAALRRGDLVGLFPEGIAGVEKRYTERYRLRPFKSGTARLSVRTGSPIVPVAIVGAEEAYPVVLRLYRAGNLVGLPWIPVTPLFPLCGVAGALPLPSKWYMRFGAPIEPAARDGQPEEDAVRALTARLEAAIARMVADLLAERRCAFL
jgi:1-acyl-sn-glycerol-3-phosphate acyltransferase